MKWLNHKILLFISHHLFCYFYLFRSGLINVKRLRVEDRLSDSNNQPIEVRVLIWNEKSYFYFLFIRPNKIKYPFHLKNKVPFHVDGISLS